MGARLQRRRHDPQSIVVDRYSRRKEATEDKTGWTSHAVEGASAVRPADAITGLVTMNFSVRVADFEQLSSLLARLAGVPNVIEARRVA